MLFIALFSISFSAEAKSLVKFFRALSCGQLLSAQSQIAKVEKMVGDIGEHKSLATDSDDEDLIHVRAHIYHSKDFNPEQVVPDVTDEFNFSVSPTEVSVQVLDSKIANRAFHILERLPEHFAYARKKSGEYLFDVKYLPLFIAEIRKLGFAFY